MHAHGLGRREFLFLLTDLIAFVIGILDQHKFLRRRQFASKHTFVE